ncbi:MAG: DUF427 domain-containing protein [Pseudomonadota bacterium]
MTDLIPENVQDYSRPPALEPVPQRLRVLFAGQTVADTVAGYRVLETHHAPTYYLPPEDVRTDLLTSAGGGSFCEWKGRAQYWTIEHSGQRADRAVWSYATPTPRFASIAGYFAFYAALVEACYVGDTKVLPQPGSFYGGWVTPNLDGIIKGGPGTEGW